MLKRILYLISIIIIGFSCKKKTHNIDLGYGYFPLDSSIVKIFQVTSIQHDAALIPAHDTSYYQIKEVFGASFIDDIGEEALELKRFIRLNDTSIWQIKDLWVVKKTATQAIKIKENKSLIELAFGVTYSKIWDLNVLNSDDPTESYYLNINKKYTINSFLFDSTCTVIHEDFKSLVDFDYHKKVYSKEVGEVFSIYKKLDINNFDTLDISKGVELKFELISYSN